MAIDNIAYSVNRAESSLIFYLHLEKTNSGWFCQECEK